MKREGELKSKFVRAVIQQLPGFYALQYATNGAPDRELVGAGMSTRWEGKHATPDFRSPGDQELMCQRLAHVGHCRYIVWWERGLVQKTLIVHPRDIARRVGWELIPEAFCIGFDMDWLVAQVRIAHNL